MSSFAVKKNNEVTYISQNNSTKNPSFDNWSENGTSIFNNNTGNVGINISNPGFNLDVSGSTNVSGNLIVDTNALFVNSINNQVGINTSTPSYTLDVSGNANISGTLIVNDISNVRLYPVAIYAAGLNQNIAQNTSADLSFNQVTNGVNGAIISGWTYNPATRFLTCPSNGLYSITVTADVIAFNDTSINIVTSNPVYPVVPIGSCRNIGSLGSTGPMNVSISWIFNLVANQQVKLTCANIGAIPGNSTIQSLFLTIQKIA